MIEEKWEKFMLDLGFELRESESENSLPCYYLNGYWFQVYLGKVYVAYIIRNCDRLLYHQTCYLNSSTEKHLDNVMMDLAGAVADPSRAPLLIGHSATKLIQSLLGAESND